MTGAELRKLIEASDLRPEAIYSRAKITRNRYYKIFAKKSVSVSDLEALSRAINRKPGDMLENSAGEIEHLQPLIALLQQLDSAAIPRVEVMLREMLGLCSDVAARSGSPAGPTKSKRSA